MAMTPPELLARAAEHIEKYGLAKGHWVPDEFIDDSRLTSTECPACVGGAVVLVVSGGREWSPNFARRPSERKTMEAAFDLLVERLALALPASGSALDAIIEWSDSSTQSAVIAGLRKAAG